MECCDRGGSVGVVKGELLEHEPHAAAGTAGALFGHGCLVAFSTAVIGIGGGGGGGGNRFQP